MAPEVDNGVLSHAIELERRDAAVGAELAAVGALTRRVDAVRVRVATLRDAVASLPAERQQLAARHEAADEELAASRAAHEAAEARLAELSASRRRRSDEVERAEKQLSTARETLADAEVRLQRVADAVVGLRTIERDNAAEADALADEVTTLVAEIGSLDRVARSTTREPGSGLEALAEWSSQARSALFVARGTLEQERERIVAEANALGSAVLGEQLGGSSATLVRQRIEANLA